MGRLFHLGTINVRTLATNDKQIEFEQALNDINWDVIAVQEARIVGCASFNLIASGTVIFHSGGQSATHGVAFLLRPQLAARAIFQGLSPRLATLQLPSQRLHLVCAYAPTSSYPDAEYDSFMDEVDAALQRTPRGFTPILMGDFNCRVSKESGNEHLVGSYASTSPNARGRSFMETCQLNNLRIWNTCLKRRQGRLWTWRSPNGATFNQIDFIAAPPSAPVIDCGVVNRFQFNSDHRLVRMSLSLGSRVPRKHKKRRERLDFDRGVYAANSHVLGGLPPAAPQSASEAYKSIVDFTEVASMDCWRRRQIPPWISLSTRRLLSDRLRLRNNSHSFSVACKAARAALREDIRKRKENQAKQAAILGRSILKAGQQLHSTRKRLLVPDPLTGELSQTATKTAVRSFYEALYTPAVSLPLAVPLSSEPLHPFMADETRHALSFLKCGHSPGSDGVLPDMLNISREYLAQPLADLLNHLVSGDSIPESLVEATVTLLHKKGDATNVSNFRPISLLTVTLKSITRVILQRMEKSLDESESITQTGFRRGCSTLDNLHAIKQIAERTHEYEMPLYLAFVDFTKAFDCVEWNAVWQALWRSGVHFTLIHLLRRLYESSTTLIRVNEELVPVRVKRGVRQGDTLSPRLFNAVLRLAMDDIDWENCGLKIDGRHLSHLEYADDVALIAKTRPELEKMLKKLMDACELVGLEVNPTKTVLLTSCTTTRSPIIIDRHVFNFVDSTTYLGGRISLPLDSSKEVEHRIRQGWAAWSKLHHLLATKLLPMKIKRRLFDSCISSTVLYGSEVWSLRTSDKERLNITLRKMERKMIGVTLMNRMRNERLREITRIRDWNEEALKRKAKWVLKIRQMETSHWTRATTVWIPYSWKRPKGRPPTRWSDDIRRTIGPLWWKANVEEYRSILT